MRQAGWLLLLIVISCRAAPLKSVPSFARDYEGGEEDRHRVVAGTSAPAPQVVQSEGGYSTAEVLPDGEEESDNEPLLEGKPAVEADDIERTLHLLSPSPEPRHLRHEMRTPVKKAKADDARDDMKPKPEDPLDADCDSPQLGESEPWPIKGGSVEMNNLSSGHMENNETVVMKEQSDKYRDVPLDRQAFVHAAAIADDPAAHTVTASEPTIGFPEPIEIDKRIRLESLPGPSAEEAKKAKCSRWLNGHDVPDPLQMLDDDCGMPEPEIPCETPGNSTLCVPRMQLEPPPIPKAELMPNIPPPPYDNSRHDNTPVNMSVEFVDFGVSIPVVTFLGNNVGRTVELAGQEFSVDAWATQLIRNGGVDVKPQIFIHDLQDRTQLIVYLTCTYRRFQPKLIMEIPACEDFLVKNLTARIEVPAMHDVFEVTVLSTEKVWNVLARSPVDLDKIEKITYDGKTVSLDTPLEEIYFRDGSAFIVYPTEPCPSHTPSPSVTPTSLPSFSPTPSPVWEVSPSPIPVKVKVRKGGAYDVFRHCRNARGEKIAPPPAEALGLDPAGADPEGRGGQADFDCEESEMTVVEEPDYSNVGGKREPYEAADPGRADVPMEDTATVIAEFDGREIPVRIKIDANGIDIMDAINLATGKDHTGLIIKYKDSVIDHYTPLKPFGFVTGDRITVSSPTIPEEPVITQDLSQPENVQAH